MMSAQTQTQTQTQPVVKMILAANTGSGKTGALASLASTGYRLRVLDLDNGCDILRAFLHDAQSPYVQANPKCGDNLESIISLSEKRKTQAGKLGIAKAEVWTKASGLLERWEDGGLNLGSITEWTPEHVLVVDSFTRLSYAALRFVLALNGRLNQHPWQSDYGDAQGLLRNFLEIVTSPDVNCNVIVNCHIDRIEDKETKVAQDWPKTVGQKLAPEIGGYFNHLLMIEKSGGKRMLKTVAALTSSIAVKNTAPFRVKAEYPLESGLSDYFAAVRGG